MFLTVKCPKCKHNMKYHTQDDNLSKKRKSCVYCGKNFNIVDNLVK